MEQILVLAIVLSALAFVVSRAKGILSGCRTPSCGSSCGGCPSAKAAPNLVSLSAPRASAHQPRNAASGHA